VNVIGLRSKKFTDVHKHQRQKQPCCGATENAGVENAASDNRSGKRGSQ